jgi:hypothetical protein
MRPAFFALVIFEIGSQGVPGLAWMIVTDQTQLLLVKKGPPKLFAWAHLKL